MGASAGMQTKKVFLFIVQCQWCLEIKKTKRLTVYKCFVSKKSGKSSKKSQNHAKLTKKSDQKQNFKKIIFQNFAFSRSRRIDKTWYKEVILFVSCIISPKKINNLQRVLCK